MSVYLHVYESSISCAKITFDNAVDEKTYTFYSGNVPVRAGGTANTGGVKLAVWTAEQVKLLGTRIGQKGSERIAAKRRKRHKMGKRDGERKR